MKIALFSDTFPPQVNGVANTVHRFALALGELGHEVRVFTISGSPTKELARYTEEKFSLHLFPSTKAVVYPELRAGIPFVKLFSAINAFAPDIIHTHTPFAVGWNAVRCARRLKVPLVGTHHTFFDHYLRHVYLEYEWARALSWRMTVRYYNYCDLVISPTHSLAEALKEHGLKKPIEVIPNILDTDFFAPAPHATTRAQKTLVYMGRLSYEKSIDDTLAAAALVMQQLPATHMLVIGDGPERTKLEQLAAELGIVEQTTFTGYLHGAELVQKLQEADVFITGSKSENMPLALLEAMAVGLPIVAVHSLGLGEILKHGGNAFLVEPGQPHALAESALQLLQDDALHRQFADMSRRMSLRYSKPVAVKRMVEMYEQSIGYAATPDAMDDLKK